MRRSIAALSLLLYCGGCRKEPPPPPVVDAAPVASAQPVQTATFDGPAVVKTACQSCHTTQMLAQQRLTPAQWTKEVTKMAGWGANLDPSDATPLAAYLAATYGPDAGEWSPPVVSAENVAAEIAAQPDTGFPPGDVERGRALYVDRCSGCHGQDARGGVGVALVERQVLYRIADVAVLVRRGKGKMLPMQLEDGQISDVLAYLRTLRVRTEAPH